MKNPRKSQIWKKHKISRKLKNLKKEGKMLLCWDSSKKEEPLSAEELLLSSSAEQK